MLSGVVGSAEERTRLIEAATVRAGGRPVVDELTVTAGAALPTGVSPTSVEAAAAALGGPVGPDTAISIADEGIALTGSVADEAASSAAGQAVAAALPGLTLDNRLPSTRRWPLGPRPRPAAPPGRRRRSAAGGRPSSTPRPSNSCRARSVPAVRRPDHLPAEQPQLTARAGLAGAADRAGKAAPGARLQVDGYVATGPGNGQYCRAAAVRPAGRRRPGRVDRRRVPPPTSAPVASARAAARPPRRPAAAPTSPSSEEFVVLWLFTQAWVWIIVSLLLGCSLVGGSGRARSASWRTPSSPGAPAGHGPSADRPPPPPPSREDVPCPGSSPRPGSGT